MSMPTTGSSSLPQNLLNLSSVNSSLSGGDDNADQADPAVWKRRYHTLQESLKEQNKSKRKAGLVNLINVYDFTGLTV